MPDFYRQPGLNVRAYDHRGSIDERPFRGDVAFLTRLLKPADGPVLELGCGTGRAVIGLARERFKVTGLEISQPMLDRARKSVGAERESIRRRIRLVQGDMTAFDLGDSFQAVVVLFRSFQMLLTPEDERRCLRAAWAHLQPGGRLVLNVFDPLLEGLAPGPVVLDDWLDTRGVGQDCESGNAVRIDVISRANDTVAQTLEEVWRFTEVGQDGAATLVEHETLRMRWIYRWEMRYLLELCGFEIEAEYSDYAESPPAYGKEQIWVARRVG